jgi:hypothetical protein
MTCVTALVLATTLSTAPIVSDQAREASIAAAPAGPLTAAIATAPAIDTPIERWMVDRKVSRPAAVAVMYGTIGALQALDVYSTRRALASGAGEVNPILKDAAGNSGALVAAKVLSTAGSIYFAERVWKKNRKAAVVLMAIVNGVTGAVVARNLRNAR